MEPKWYLQFNGMVDQGQFQCPIGTHIVPVVGDHVKLPSLTRSHTYKVTKIEHNYEKRYTTVYIEVVN